MPADFMPQDDIRSAFAAAMSAMYRDEVPLYGDLIDIVETINRNVLKADPRLAEEMRRSGELERLGGERHGAIRIGTAEELSMMRRALAVMGMHPVGYYNLAPAGVPVHSTAFRAVDPEALRRSPFRLFTSLLRLELIEDANLRASAAHILAGRRIFSRAAIDLVERAERDGGLCVDDAGRFVAELLETFRWQGEAIVDAATYDRLNRAHRLIADIVSFRGPHINHLTPRVLDIDAAQAEMPRRGIRAKAVIEGPPRRLVPILLRQTSFQALDEPIRFVGQTNGPPGSHSARFGEIEQRGAALTPKGRALYDSLLSEARADADGNGRDYATSLATAFAQFPDDLDILRKEGLAFFHYRAARDRSAAAGRFDLEALIAAGDVIASPTLYEDFLPVSAAGIFQSNLGDEARGSYHAEAEQAGFETALGAPVLDPFALYETIERRSLEEVRHAFSLR